MQRLHPPRGRKKGNQRSEIANNFICSPHDDSQAIFFGASAGSRGGDDYKALKRSPRRTIWFNVAKKKSIKGAHR